MKFITNLLQKRSSIGKVEKSFEEILDRLDEIDKSITDIEVELISLKKDLNL